MRCCQNKTSFSWSYRDSSKRSLENNVKSRRGKRKIHTLLDKWTCANGKEWSRGTKEVLVIGLHMVGKWEWIFLTWSFECTFREPGSSLYAHIFFLFLIFLILFFLSFIHFFSRHIFSPWLPQRSFDFFIPWKSWVSLDFFLPNPIHLFHHFF